MIFMLNWFTNEHDASQASALGRLLTCLVYHQPNGWLYCIMGEYTGGYKYEYKFDTRELAQAACETALAALLAPHFSKVSIIIRVDRTGAVMPELTEIAGLNPGTGQSIETAVEYVEPPFITIAAPDSNLLKELNNIAESPAFTALVAMQVYNKEFFSDTKFIMPDLKPGPDDDESFDPAAPWQ